MQAGCQKLLNWAVDSKEVKYFGKSSTMGPMELKNSIYVFP